MKRCEVIALSNIIILKIRKQNLKLCITRDPTAGDCTENNHQVQGLDSKPSLPIKSNKFFPGPLGLLVISCFGLLHFLVVASFRSSSVYFRPLQNLFNNGKPEKTASMLM